VLSFVIWALFLFGLTGYILHSSLKKKDQDLLQTKFQEYALLLKSEGVSGLQLRVSSQSIADANKFLVRHQSSSGKTLFLHTPATMEIIGWTITLQDLDAHLRKFSHKTAWLEIPGPDYGDGVEIFSKTLPDGSVLQIGKDTEDREEFLSEFVRSFALGLLPVMSLAILLGIYLSARMLAPIRWLSQTVEHIRSGETGARVPLKGNLDELDTLGVQFNQMQNQNERLVRGMKETLDHVAHDLRTPVMRIQNSAQTALQKSKMESSLEIEALLDAQENSETLLKILNAIMDISEIETGAMHLKLEKLDVSTLIKSILDIYGFIAEDRNITIINQVEAGLTILGDNGRLLQALANIIDNAIKYSPEESSIVIRGYSDADKVIFEIVDQGSGIPLFDIQRIWDRLYRGDQSRSSRGLGLGLSVVKAIARAHGAQVEVFNNFDKGCTFRLSFMT
jgi:signal transduction histidine kinase